MSEEKIIGGTPGPTTFGVPGTELLIDPTFGSVRTRLVPAEYGNQGVYGGHYQAAAVTGAITVIAGGGAIFSTRWAAVAGGPSFMLLKRVQLAWVVTTAFGAAQVIDFDIVRATAFTVSDSGGTALTPFTGNNNKVRSSIMNTSQVTDMRIAAAAALTAGTRTQDANPFGYLPAGTQPAANTALLTAAGLTDLYKDDAIAQHPQMFGNNEGFQIRVVTTMGATGIMKAYVVVTWAEVPGL
jgi:hypothetical protein